MMHPKNAPVRLKGKALTALRDACYNRDHGVCQECRSTVHDGFPDWHDRKYHMAHIVGRGAGGPDEPSNVRTLCGKCHRAEHNAGGKPVPAKPHLEELMSESDFPANADGLAV